MQDIDRLAALSQTYGSDADYVLLGGGNTSFKTGDTLYIKPSGTRLAAIRPDQFIGLDRAAVRKVFTAGVPEEPMQREAAVKHIMAGSVRPLGSGRPSVEAPLHEVIESRFVFHLHPALVNGMTCALDGEAVCRRLFPDALWVEFVDPGYTLSTVVADRLAPFAPGEQPAVIFLQNHGVFVGADTTDEIEAIYKRIMDTLRDAYRAAGVDMTLQRGTVDSAAVQALAPRLRSWLGDGADRVAVTSMAPFRVAAGPLTPDHIVYAKSFALEGELTAAAVQEFEALRGYTPRVVSTPDTAVFAAGSSLKDARGAAALAEDGALVQQLCDAFGGPRYLDDRAREFIENWEVESYRKKIESGGGSGGGLANRICVVTGAAQGFGLGIAQGLARRGATVVLADLNEPGARDAAAGIEAEVGADRALAVGVNIADEDSVDTMVAEVVAACGGFDLFVANAGVLRAGSVKEMTKADWEFVTSVNYTGYFLCVKKASRVFALQAEDERYGWTDIIQINSKSGLEGSNRNGAYAGSKFGTIGLTQSFAKELISDRVKVNSICPGNYFDGPLWSNPDNGLFVQYLETGKVPGAETLEDVRRTYEAKVPMGRGCTPRDVVRAIMYAVAQDYETGQAIPVTGGQVMLN